MCTYYLCDNSIRRERLLPAPGGCLPDNGATAAIASYPPGSQIRGRGGRGSLSGPGALTPMRAAWAQRRPDEELRGKLSTPREAIRTGFQDVVSQGPTAFAAAAIDSRRAGSKDGSPWDKK